MYRYAYNNNIMTYTQYYNNNNNTVGLLCLVRFWFSSLYNNNNNIIYVYYYIRVRRIQRRRLSIVRQEILSCRIQIHNNITKSIILSFILYIVYVNIRAYIHDPHETRYYSYNDNNNNNEQYSYIYYYNIIMTWSKNKIDRVA